MNELAAIAGIIVIFIIIWAFVLLVFQMGFSIQTLRLIGMFLIVLLLFVFLITVAVMAGDTQSCRFKFLC